MLFPDKRNQCVIEKYNLYEDRLALLLGEEGAPSALIRRLMQSGRRKSEDLDAVIGHTDGVLELR